MKIVVEPISMTFIQIVNVHCVLTFSNGHINYSLGSRTDFDDRFYIITNLLYLKS